MKIKDWLNEELIAQEEIGNRADLKPFLINTKNTLIKKGFDDKQAASIMADFLDQFNKSGFLPKIEKLDAAIKDIQVFVSGSNVQFTITSDSDMRDKKIIVVKGIASNLGQEKIVKPTGKPIDTNVYGKAEKAMGAHTMGKA